MNVPRLAPFALVAALALPAPAMATLIADTPFFQEFQGTGLGAVNTVLTVQRNPASPSGSESGCSPSGVCGTGITGGNEKTGAGQTGNPTFAELGVTSASDIRIVWNANEPQSEGNPTISLDKLVLTILNPAADTILAEFSTTGSFLVDTSVEPGIGNAGWVFRLDAAQATAADLFLDASNRVGLGANLSLAAGGPETFFVASAEAIPPVAAASEPGLLLLAGGFLGLAGVFRRRQRH